MSRFNLFDREPVSKDARAWPALRIAAWMGVMCALLLWLNSLMHWV